MSSVSSSLDNPYVHLKAFGGAFVIIALIFVAAAVAVSVGGAAVSVIGIGRDTALGLALMSAFQFIGFGIVGIGYAYLTDQLHRIGLTRPTSRDLVWIIGGLLALIGLFAGINALFGLLGIESADSAIIDQGQDNPVYFLYLIPVTIFLVGPAEELIFRGLIQTQFRDAYGSTFAVVAASTVFAAVHFSSYSGGDISALLATLMTILVLGATLGVLYERTQTLLVPAVVHGLFNTIQFAMAYISIASGSI
jgi:CAAX amino terminal protease family.